MKKLIFSITILLVSIVNIYSQDYVHSLYFLNGWSQRHTLNAAFAPQYSYFSLPILGGVEVSVNANVGLSTFLYPSIDPTNLKPMLIMNKNVDASLFLNKLDPFTYINEGLNLNLLSLGFYTKQNSFWSFDIYLKEKLNVNIPKDLFKLMKSGMTSSTNYFDLKNLGINQTNYLQASLGYSRDILSNLRVGLNAKLLVGISSERMKYTQFDVNLNQTAFSVNSAGQLDVISNMVSFNKDANNYYDLANPVFHASSIKPSGYGFAGDIGVTYKPIQKLTLAAGINDLGFISWNAASIKHGVAESNFSFAGFNNLTVSDSITAQLNQLQTDASNLIKFKESALSKNIIDNLPYKINVSAEYSIFGNEKHDILVGLLYQNINQPNMNINDLVGALTFKPFSWLSLSGTYEVTNRNFNRYGAAINISPSWINLFIASDYIVPKLNPQYIPLENAQFNIAFGGSISLGKGRDSDKDGVIDRKDKCPDTPLGVKVDKHGCPIDSDGDGVPDYLDKCPNTPHGVKVDAQGCPLDADGDGVPDYLDQCPNTPKAAIGFVDAHGCPLDTDKDGVPDYLDKCPDTPQGVAVDSVGCPLDTDGDGVPDYLDKCPDTPKAAKGMVDKNGCLLDSDGDGVPDYLDLCNNTPAEARAYVDKNGCLKDTDGDGVPDYLDKCPDTPIEARGKVDEHGCPRDTDGDGIPDYLDNCPTIPGVASNHGCPEIKKEVRTLFQRALQGIQFETGRSTILKKSDIILNQIAKSLINNPTYLIEVQGHTDNVGKSEANMKLSEARANAVRQYLIAKGVEEKRITAKGYGDTRPIASNKTVSGRAKNRRVEFLVTFEEVSVQK